MFVAGIDGKGLTVSVRLKLFPTQFPCAPDVGVIEYTTL